MQTAASTSTPLDFCEDRRQRILDTALRLFGSVGYFNTSLQDIRREADVSIGTIYHYFQNKEAIAGALYQELVAMMSSTLDSIFAAHDATHSRGRAVMAFFFEMTETAPEAMHYILYARHQEFMPAQVPICSAEPFAKIVRMVVRGMERGEIRTMHPMIATTTLFGGAMRLIHLYLDGVLDMPLGSCLEESWECGWRAVAAD